MSLCVRESAPGSRAVCEERAPKLASSWLLAGTSVRDGPHAVVEPELELSNTVGRQGIRPEIRASIVVRPGPPISPCLELVVLLRVLEAIRPRR